MPHPARPVPADITVTTVVDQAEMDDLRLPARDEQRLVLVMAGSKRIESGADGPWRAADYRPGVVGMTAPGRATRLRWRATSKQVRTLHVVVPGALVRQVGRDLWGRDDLDPLDALVADDPLLVQLMQAIGRAGIGASEGGYVEAGIQFALVHLLSRRGNLPVPELSGREDARVEAAEEFMVAHLAEPVALADIAAAVGLSPYHFLRVHKAATGTTPMRRMTQLRVAAARRMLADGTSSVTEVAYACGFSSPAHLSTAFARQVGTTPSRYRAESRR